MASVSSSEFMQMPRDHASRAGFRVSGLLLSLIFLVVVPICATGWYLWARSVDYYVSEVGFSVRSEETQAPTDFFGSLTQFTTNSAKDSDILYEFIQSQELVQTLDRKLNLRDIYARDYAIDPVFSLAPSATIEELVRHWRRVALVNYVPSTGLLEVQIRASDPDTAQIIARSVFEECSLMINRLSAIARSDATHYANADLNDAVDQLKSARQAVTKFRSRTQIFDPAADIQVQMGLLNSLQQKLGEELISYDLLVETTRTNDPRILAAEQRIGAIRKRIAQERRKFGLGGNLNEDTASGNDYATMVTEYERLKVDQEFSQQKYTAALTNVDLAKAEAQRKTRYLAAYVQPTLAESPLYPRRILIFSVTGLILMISWAILGLIVVSLRDRR